MPIAAKWEQQEREREIDREVYQMLMMLKINYEKIKNI
jgi:hypothetical protein